MHVPIQTRSTTTASTAHPPRDVPEAPADGRAARSHRTVEQIIAALLELVERDGHLRPTAHQVARRAGVSRRGLYLHFASLEDLFAAAAERRCDEVQASWQALPPDSDLHLRIDSFCRRWATVLESLNPLRRAAAIQEPFSHPVAVAVARTRRWARTTVEWTFLPELVTTPMEDRLTLVNALHHATSWHAWDDLRGQGADVDEASRAMRRLLVALLCDSAAPREAVQEIDIRYPDAETPQDAHEQCDGVHAALLCAACRPARG